MFRGNWDAAWQAIGNTVNTVWDKMTNAIKTAVNGIIGFINRMISAVVTGINAVINALNGLSFDLPDIFGGGHVGFNISTLTAPQIPYLAQGAVIPANREFLAVLGDQSHGTNVEAPLTPSSRLWPKSWRTCMRARWRALKPWFPCCGRSSPPCTALS